MRIWHKSLVRYLPDRLLVKLWKECRELACHDVHLFSYGMFVVDELHHRGMHVPYTELRRFIIDCNTMMIVPFGELYDGWHDERYLAECWFALYEMHSVGLVSDTDWDAIQEGVNAA